jgi:hypothetical protein
MLKRMNKKNIACCQADVFLQARVLFLDSGRRCHAKIIFISRPFPFFLSFSHSLFSSFLTFIISAHSVNAISPLITQSPPSKTQPQNPKHMQQALQARQKKVQVYTWTVEALQRQYQRRLCEDRLLAQKHEQEWTRLHHHRQQLEHTISDYTQQIQTHETALQAARAHAQQRQSKYHTRQRQFHRYAKIPVLGGTYKQKYLRAQKKNQVAESDVAAQRHGIDHIKDSRTALVRQL